MTCTWAVRKQMALCAVLTLVLLPVVASTTTLLTTTETRNAAFRRGASDRISNDERTCVLDDRTGTTRECADPADDDSTTSRASPSSPSALAQELLRRGSFAMERGIQYSNHLAHLIQLVQASSPKKKKNSDAFTGKWRSIHEKAVQSLEEAFQLFVQASRTTPVVAVDSREGLLRVRHYLVELHGNALYPPPSLVEESDDLYLINSRRASNKEEVLMHRAREAFSKGRRYWQHMSQVRNEVSSPIATSDPARWAARWRFLHTQATKALRDALHFFSMAGVMSTELEEVRQLMLQVQSKVVLVDLVPAIKVETNARTRETLIRM